MGEKQRLAHLARLGRDHGRRHALRQGRLHEEKPAFWVPVRVHREHARDVAPQLLGDLLHDVGLPVPRCEAPLVAVAPPANARPLSRALAHPLHHKATAAVVRDHGPHAGPGLRAGPAFVLQQSATAAQWLEVVKVQVPAHEVNSHAAASKGAHVGLAREVHSWKLVEQGFPKEGIIERLDFTGAALELPVGAEVRDLGGPQILNLALDRHWNQGPDLCVRGSFSTSFAASVNDSAITCASAAATASTLIGCRRELCCSGWDPSSRRGMQFLCRPSRRLWRSERRRRLHSERRPRSGGGRDSRWPRQGRRCTTTPKCLQHGCSRRRCQQSPCFSTSVGAVGSMARGAVRRHVVAVSGSWVVGLGFLLQPSLAFCEVRVDAHEVYPLGSAWSYIYFPAWVN